MGTPGGTGRRATLVLTMLALAATLAGCGGGDPSASPARTDSADSAASPSGPPPDSRAPEPLPGPQVRGFEEYVALGDSYSSAPGVPPLDPEGGACLRSDANYASLVAERLAGATSTDRTCAGADSRHLTRPQRTFDGGRVEPQLTALTPATDLVTVGLGGNDFGLFTTVIGTCARLRDRDPTGAPCREDSRTGGGEVLLGLADDVRGRVAPVLAEIGRRSPQARVLLVGYPDPFPESGTCPDRLPLADGDYAFAGEIFERLNRSLRRAAAATGAEYVDVAGPSRGHDICADDPWVNGQQPAPDAQIFHPFPAHQVAVAELVVETLGQPQG